MPKNVAAQLILAYYCLADNKPFHIAFLVTSRCIAVAPCAPWTDDFALAASRQVFTTASTPTASVPLSVSPGGPRALLALQRTVTRLNFRYLLIGGLFFCLHSSMSSLHRKAVGKIACEAAASNIILCSDRKGRLLCR